MIENAKKLYNTRNYIVKAFKEKEQTKEDEQSEDEMDQKLQPWVEESKERFDEIKNIINKAVKNKLWVMVDKSETISVKKARDLLDRIISKSDEKLIDRRTFDMYKDIVEDSKKKKANESNPTGPRIIKCF